MKIEINHILYPTDFSELSLKSLRYAAGFCHCYSAKLHCIHVVDEAYNYWTTLGPEALPVGITPEHLGDLAKKQMTTFRAKHLAPLGENIETAVLYGRPYQEICRYAQEHKVELIIVATHGHSGLGHALLGSTAEKVVRHAPCPVLTVRDPQHSFVKP